MLETIVLAIRAVQFIFAIIVLGLTAYFATGPVEFARNSFMLFVSVWTVLVVIVLALAPRFGSGGAIKLLSVGLDGLTALFWFAAFVALAVLYHNDYFYNYDLYDDYVYRVCNEVDNGCSVMEAAVVFGAFEWALFTATAVLSAFETFRGRKRGTAAPAA